VRVAPHLYNDTGDVERLFAALASGMRIRESHRDESDADFDRRSEATLLISRQGQLASARSMLPTDEQLTHHRSPDNNSRAQGLMMIHAHCSHLRYPWKSSCA
jgi:hypothetical protein